MEWVAIAQRADGQGVVCGETFRDCTIVGPALLVPVAAGNRLRDCDFMRPPARGAGGEAAATVYLIDCLFERCRFDSSISFLPRRDGALT